MATIRSSADIAMHLAAAEQAVAGPPHLHSLQDSVGSLLQEWPRERGLYAQLKRLADFIDTTRTEIAALKPVEVNTTFIPTATDELDAIVEATAKATNQIMDAAEVLSDVAGKLAPEHADQVMAAVTSIYEACTFQDITGQRITKVIKTLKVIQQRLDQMIQSVDTTNPDAGAPSGYTPVTTAPPEVNGDAALLNGPALPGNGKNQDEIDALFASFE